ncbi:MAG: hypothetical protein HQ567_10735 [Candidatus Nealsonbacteria bacterium]|nr:hypothetical protein [Candidatus Nealsonbacteria bacterium]
MNKIVHGVIHGKTIHLTEDPGIADGQEVQVALAAVPPEKAWGDGIRRSAGGWADDPEMNAVMERIQEDRGRERRPQVP